jgi:hypothetical protein
MTDAWPLVALLALSVVALIVVVRTGTIRAEQATTRRAVEYHGRAELAAALHPPVAGAAAVTFNPHWVYSPHVESAVTQAPGVAGIEASLALPAPGVPSFAALLAAGTIGPGQPLVLGYAAGHLLTGALRDWRSGGIGGLPGSGKTTTQRFIAGQCALAGARLVVLDPHGDAGADSLAGTLAPLAPAFLCAPATEPPAMLAALHLVQDVMRARLAGGAAPWPLFVFVDEWTALAARSDLGGPLAELLEAIAQEGRKTLCQGVISGQIWTAARAGGTGLRDSLASTYVHRMKRNQARVLLPADEAARAETLPTGTAMLWRADGSLQEVTIPQTTEADMVAIWRVLSGYHQTTNGHPAENDAVPTWLPTTVAIGKPVVAVGSPEAMRALGLFVAYKSMARVVEEMYGVRSNEGRRYQDKLAEVSALVADAIGARP